MFVSTRTAVTLPLGRSGRNATSSKYPAYSVTPPRIQRNGCTKICTLSRTRGASSRRFGRLVEPTRATNQETRGLNDAEVKIAVFVSGGGSNLRALYDATKDGRIRGDITVVVSDKPGCGGWEFAISKGITTIQYPGSELTGGQLAEELVRSGVTFVALAGYLKLVPKQLCQAYPRAMINIHPALLPAFGGKGYYGMNVHRAVVASGVRFSGPTVHFVDEEYDKGKVVAQRCVPVLASDNPEDVAARVLEQEHELYPEVLGALSKGNIRWREDGVPIIVSDSGER